MKENELNKWLEIAYEKLSNKRPLFLKVNNADTQKIIDNLKIPRREYISIIKIENLKDIKRIPAGINQIIISENYYENVENMKEFINREIIYVEDKNSINKLINLINNKSFDTANEVRYELIQKVDFESLFKKNNLDIKKFIFDRLDLLKKINCNFGNMDIDSLIFCLENYYKNKILFANFAQLLYRLVNLDFKSSEKHIGGNIRKILGIKSKTISRKNLVYLKVTQLEKSFRVYDLKENPFEMDIKINIAQKLVKLNIKELDITKISKVINLPLKKIERMYRETFLK